MGSDGIAVTIFLTTSLILAVKCSALVSFSEPDPDEAHDRFEVSKFDDDERLFRLINSKYDRSLIVEIRNAMAGSSGTSTIISDCYAYSNSGQLLLALGAGPIIPREATIYWMNLIFFSPSIAKVDCNMTAPAGNSRTLTMYDGNNMELSSLTIQWSTDERGFSLYYPESDSFNLYETW